jgi:hypothetical protein
LQWDERADARRADVRPGAVLPATHVGRRSSCIQRRPWRLVWMLECEWKKVLVGSSLLPPQLMETPNMCTLNVEDRGDAGRIHEL